MGYFIFEFLRPTSPRAPTWSGWLATMALSLPLPLTDVIAIYSGQYAFIALKTDNTIVAWGLNSSSAISGLPSALQGNISYQE